MSEHDRVTRALFRLAAVAHGTRPNSQAIVTLILKVLVDAFGADAAVVVDGGRRETVVKRVYRQSGPEVALGDTVTLDSEEYAEIVGGTGTVVPRGGITVSGEDRSATYLGGAVLPLFRADGKLSSMLLVLGVVGIGDQPEAAALLALAGRLVTQALQAAWLQAEQATTDAMLLYQSLVETSPDGILQLALDGTILFANSRAAKLYGVGDASELVGLNGFSLIAPEERATAAERAAEADRRRESTRNVEYTIVRRDGSRFPVELSTTRISDAAGRVTTRMVLVHDITDRKATERALEEAVEALRYQVLHDVLTGLPNRSLLDDRLAQAMRTATRDGVSVALMLLDLDGFKHVNDTLGHAAGDALLKQVAARLQDTVRTSDTVARLGGDEFVVMLPRADEQGAIGLATKIVQRFGEPFMVGGTSVDIGASVGIALFPTHASDAGGLQRVADQAMYEAKRTGTGFRVAVAGVSRRTGTG